MPTYSHILSVMVSPFVPELLAAAWKVSVVEVQDDNVPNSTAGDLVVSVMGVAVGNATAGHAPTLTEVVEPFVTVPANVVVKLGV